MKSIENFENDINMHTLGLSRLIASGSTEMDEPSSFELAKKVINLCQNSNLPYREIQKAIVYADNSLYYKLKINHDDAYSHDYKFNVSTNEEELKRVMRNTNLHQKRQNSEQQP